MNKRGFIFTFISVTLVSVILLAFLIQYTSRTKVEIEKTSTEIETMNSFVKSLNNDYLPRALGISGNQAILALLLYMERNDDYLDDSIQRVKNAMYSGRYEINDADAMELMEINGISYNLTSTLYELINLANYTSINFEFNDININSVNVFQGDPWHINFTMTISYNIYNKDNDVSWTYTNVLVNSSVPVSNFREPVYLILIADENNPDDGINVTINQSVYLLPDYAAEHAHDKVFIECSLAPDFLERMEGLNGEASQYGIESLVEDARYNNAVSSIDYQYLLGIGGIGLQLTEIDGSGYHIDSSHVGCYNIG